MRNAVNAYADEMATALCKSAYNMMIYEVRDFCCGLIDADGRMISQNRGGLPIFLADLGIAVKDGIARYGLSGFKPGDVIIMNHGRVCGQHLNNVVVYAPCFHADEVVAFAASRAHWVDIGGMRVGFGSVEVTVASPGEANSGNEFRFDEPSGRYLYNLSTRGLATGTYRADALLDDGSTHSVQFSVR